MANVLEKISEPDLRSHFKKSTEPGKVRCKYCDRDLLLNATRLKVHLARIKGRDTAICTKNPDEVIYLFKMKYKQIQMQKAKRRQVDKVLHDNTSNLFRDDESIAMEAAHIARTQRNTFESISECSNISGHASNASGMGSSGSEGLHGISGLAPSRTRPGCQPTLLNFDEDKQQHARNAVAEFLYLHNLPLHILDHPVTQDLFDTIIAAGPGFQIPSYNELRTTLLDEVKSDITSTLPSHRKAWERTGSSLMCDGWADERGRSILNFMVASREGTMFLKSIDFSSGTKAGDYLHRVLVETIREIGEDKVVQVLSNNAAHFVGVGDSLMVTFPHLVYTPCAAHCIDLMLKDIGKISWVNAVIKIAKRMTKFLYAHTVIRNHMMSVMGKEILRPDTTRFATNFILLKSLNDSRDGLVQMFISAYWRTKPKLARYRSSRQYIEAKRNALDDGFWDRVEIVMKIAAPIVTVLRLVDSEGQPMGELYHSMQVCIDEIKSTLEEAGESDKYAEVEGIFLATWKGQLYQDIHAAAHALNPRYGFGNDFTDEGSQDIPRRLCSYIQRCYDDIQYVIALQKELELYKGGRVPSGNPIVSMGIHTLDAYTWWRANSHEYPYLAELATRILTQPCSSLGCEPDWSVFEQMQTKRCNRLASKRLNDLMYVHYNLKLQYKKLMRPMSSFVAVEDVDISTPAAQWMSKPSGASTEAPPELVMQNSPALAACASSSRGEVDSSDEEDDEFFDPSSDDHV